jgi:type IV pilus assembly protein PilA
MRVARSIHPQRRDGGFSSLEALLVIAATALLGALGVSALRTYLVRGEIEESVALARYAQHQVTRAFRRAGTPPADREAAGLGEAAAGSEGRYVEETRVVDGRIDLVFGAAANAVLAGRTLSLTPFETAAGEVVWVCGSKPPGVGLKPLGFAGGGPLPVQPPATIEPRYLPPACR